MPPDVTVAERKTPAGAAIGRPPMSPEDPLCTTSVMIPTSVKVGIVRIGERKGQSYSEVIRDALTALVRRDDARTAKRRD